MLLSQNLFNGTDICMNPLSSQKVCVCVWACAQRPLGKANSPLANFLFMYDNVKGRYH